MASLQWQKKYRMEWFSGYHLETALISQMGAQGILSLVQRKKLLVKSLIPLGSFPWDFLSSLLSVLDLYLICINWASKTEGGDRAAFLCVNTTAQRVHSCKKKKQPFKKTGSGDQLVTAGSGGCHGDKASDRLWREHHFASSFAGLIDELKLYRELWLPSNRQLGNECCLLCLPTAKVFLCPWPGVEGRLYFHFPCSHRQPWADYTSARFSSKWSTEFNFWFFRNCLNKWLVLILAKCHSSTQCNSPYRDDTV